MKTAEIIEADKPLSQLELGQLARIANGAHADAEKAALETGTLMAASVQHAVRAGAALTEAKGRLKHGGWLPWLEENFEGEAETAQRYMRVFKNREKVLPSNTSHVTYLSQAQILKLISGSSPHVSKNTGEMEWYTPPEFIEAARKIMGGIDLDPASCETANATIKAKRIYTKEDDGLSKAWKGRVWMNPPYASKVVDAFAEKLAQETRVGNVTAACVLVNNATETDWFRCLSNVADAVCFPNKRVKFLDREGNPVGAPLQGQAIVYIGRDTKAFVAGMESIGAVWVKP